MEVKFYRNPGFYYDLYNMLIMKLNSQTKWRDRVVNDGYEKEDMIYIESMMKRFPMPAEKLMVFFNIRGRRTKNYFLSVYMDVLGKYQENMKLSNFLDYFDDENKIRQEICDYYFDEKVDGNDLMAVSKLIYSNTWMKEDLKFHLLHFFMDVPGFLVELKKQLKDYEKILKFFYDDNEQKLLEEQKLFDFEEFAEGIKSILGNEITPKTEEKVSYTIIIKNVIFNDDTKGWSIVGYDYKKMLSNERNLQVDLEKFGYALGDPHRRRIMQYILENGEQTGGDIARQLGMALNTVNYHLEIMQKAHVLCCRLQGKTSFYWLNVRTCERIIEVFNSWIKQLGGEIR